MGILPASVGKSSHLAVEERNIFSFKLLFFSLSFVYTHILSVESAAAR